MLHTRICDLLGVEHPIISAPMTGTATAELAAAVSNAGGFGMIGSRVQPDPEWLREQIHTTRELTNRPFGVGFISSAPGMEKAIEVAIEEKVAAISHSFADVTPFVSDAHAAGIKVLAQVQTVALAVSAALAGVDVITAQGTEAGGHTGNNGTLPLVAAVVDIAGGIPVLASGGIGDGRGLAAVLMLGAEGAWIGTRFVASLEWGGPDWVRQKVTEASADDTLLTKVYDLAGAAPFPPEISHRVLRNDFTDTWHGRDQEIIARRQELQDQIDAAALAGDTRIASVNAGGATGLIDRVEPAGDIVRRIVAETEAILRSRPGQVLGG